MDKELTFNTGYTSRVDEELLGQLQENFEKQTKDYLEISKNMATHDFIDEYSVDDGGYELSETIDDVVCVDNIDHSADFLNPPYIDEKVLMCDSCTGYTFYVIDEKLKEGLERFKEQLQRVSHVFAGLEEEFEKIESIEPTYDISWIRKRMKHCTNPMERKQLEKQLNAAFKAKKKGRKK